MGGGGGASPEGGSSSTSCGAAQQRRSSESGGAPGASARRRSAPGFQKPALLSLCGRRWVEATVYTRAVVLHRCCSPSHCSVVTALAHPSTTHPPTPPNNQPTPRHTHTQQAVPARRRPDRRVPLLHLSRQRRQRLVGRRRRQRAGGAGAVRVCPHRPGVPREPQVLCGRGGGGGRGRL